MAAEIVGNLTGAIIITKASGPSFFIIMGVIMVVDVIGFFFMKLPDRHESEGHEEEE